MTVEDGGPIHRLHREGFQAFRTVVLTVRFADFETKSRARTLALPTDDAATLHREALKLLLPFLDRRDNPGLKLIRLLGLRVEKLASDESDLMPPGQLFDFQRLREGNPIHSRILRIVKNDVRFPAADISERRPDLFGPDGFDPACLVLTQKFHQQAQILRLGVNRQYPYRSQPLARLRGRLRCSHPRA